jgi:hypothetical protein
MTNFAFIEDALERAGVLSMKEYLERGNYMKVSIRRAALFAGKLMLSLMRRRHAGVRY